MAMSTSGEGATIAASSSSSAADADAALMSASAPPALSPLAIAASDPAAAALPPPPPPPTEPEPLATKRRASSFQDRLPLRAPTRSAVASALASVSSATTERFAKFRSLSSDAFLKKAADAPSAQAQAPLARTGSWKANVHGLAQRARDAAKRAKSGTRAFSWEYAPCCATRAFEFHGEDAGAAAAYFHVVSDGVSSPFGRNSLAQTAHEPVSSALLATELVRAVQQALQDITTGGAECLDLKTFESVVVDAIRATRIKCFKHRQSRLAATLAVAYFDRWHGRLLTFALGDSKCVVVRQHEIVFESAAVLRDFNMPTVVNLSTQVTPADYALESFALQEGDICMTFSDGIGDNLYKDDIERAVQAAGLQSNSSSSSSGGDDRDNRRGTALQQLCDELVYQSQMKISIERAQELAAAADKDAERAARGSGDGGDPEHDGAESENEPPNARISVHGAPVRGLFPFATAAALEYRARALEECSPPTDAAVRAGERAATDHLACSLALYEKHKAKRTLDRQTFVRKSSSRKRHYSLLQLKRMAEMQTKKPDDITLFVTQFR